MNQLLQSLQGYKTHSTCAIVMALCLGQWFKWWTLPTEVYIALAAMALSFLRSGVSRETGAAYDSPNDAAAATSAPQTSGPGAAGKPILGILMGIMLLAASSLYLVGCAGSLAPGGAYAPMTTNAVTGATEMLQAPDLPFFQVEFAFSIAHDAAALAFSAERNNRALLWKVSPSIKHTLDSVRPEVDKAELDYAHARTAYMANPIPANLDTMQTILDRLKAAAAAAQAVIPSSTSTNSVPAVAH